MASPNKSAAEAAANYRAALVENNVETLVGDLAVKMGEWKKARDARRAAEAAHRIAEEAAEAAVVKAYDAARGGGAKVSALEKIDLKPAAAIAAVNKRAKAGKETKLPTPTAPESVSPTEANQTTP